MAEKEEGGRCGVHPMRRHNQVVWRQRHAGPPHLIQPKEQRVRERYVALSSSGGEEVSFRRLRNEESPAGSGTDIVVVFSETAARRQIDAKNMMPEVAQGVNQEVGCCTF